MTDKSLILVVDDEELNFELMKFALKDEYDLDHVVDGESCLAFLEKQRPTLILLDIRMPGMSGYDVCKRIKSDSRYTAIPVIFVSSLDTLDERLAGYDAGGDDYVVKPFSAEELLRKVRLTIAYKTKFTRLESQNASATKAALDALTTSGELGVVIEFLRKSHGCVDVDGLAGLAFEALASYGLNAVLLIEARGVVATFDSSGAVKPIEGALLTKLRSQGRIFNSGARTVINYPGISLLIKNMPVDDGAKIGRYRDNLALLVEGAQSRIEGLNAEFELREQKKALARLIEKHQNILTRVRNTNEKNKTLSVQILDDLVATLEEAFPTLGLSERQEEILTTIVSTAASRGAGLYEHGAQVGAQLTELLDEIRQVSM